MTRHCAWDEKQNKETLMKGKSDKVKQRNVNEMKIRQKVYMITLVFYIPVQGKIVIALVLELPAKGNLIIDYFSALNANQQKKRIKKKKKKKKRGLNTNEREICHMIT